MNEEQAVLDFFSQEENLPLALIAAEHLDAIRLRLNNRFLERPARTAGRTGWHKSIAVEHPITEDRNNEECLVGLQLQPQDDQPLSCVRSWNSNSWATAIASITA